MANILITGANRGIGRHMAAQLTDRAVYYRSTYDSPLGRMTLASDGTALVGLWLPGQKYFGAGLLDGAAEEDGLPVFSAARDWLDRYFGGQAPDPGTLALAPVGSPFRQQVWRLLCQIPYGGTTSYGALAARLARELGRTAMSARAVGGAVGHNPISVIIPCHRVVGADGRLTGYAGGVEAKRWLLRHEGAALWDAVPGQPPSLTSAKARSGL